MGKHGRIVKLVFKISKEGTNYRYLDASKTREEKKTRIEKISLVSCLSEKQKKCSLPCADVLKEKIDFYQNSNLNVILIAFGPLEKNNMKY